MNETFDAPDTMMENQAEGSVPKAPCKDYSEEKSGSETDSSENDGPTMGRNSIKPIPYVWNQNNNYIKIHVDMRNIHTLPMFSMNCTGTESSVRLRIEDLEEPTYKLSIHELLEPIDVYRSKCKLKQDNMLVMYLAKACRNYEWSHLTKLEKDLNEQHKTRSNKGNDEAGAGGAGENLEMERNNDRAIEADGPKQSLSLSPTNQNIIIQNREMIHYPSINGHTPAVLDSSQSQQARPSQYRNRRRVNLRPTRTGNSWDKTMKRRRIATQDKLSEAVKIIAETAHMQTKAILDLVHLSKK